MWGSRSGSDVKVLFTLARGAELNPTLHKRLCRVACAHDPRDGGGDGRVPGSFWPAESGSSRVRERLCLKSKAGKDEEDTKRILTIIHMHTYKIEIYLHVTRVTMNWAAWSRG